MSEQIEIIKSFYKISEVCKIINVNSSTLRFWEKEFDCLTNIRKNNKGDRMYTISDINHLKLIFHLVKEKGYTLPGANEVINLQNINQKSDLSTIDRLKKIKSFLEELKKSI